MLVSISSDLSEDNILLTFVTAFFILCLFGEMVEKDPEGWGEGKKGSEFPSEIKCIPMAFGGKKGGGVNSWTNDTSITSQGGRGKCNPPKKTAGLMSVCLFYIAVQNLFCPQQQKSSH